MGEQVTAMVHHYQLGPCPLVHDVAENLPEEGEQRRRIDQEEADQLDWGNGNGKDGSGILCLMDWLRFR